MRAFLDTSVLFAAVLSSLGGSRKVLQLGEAGVISLWVGPRVLAEAHSVVQRKDPTSLSDLALLLEASKVQIGPKPGRGFLEMGGAVTEYAADVHILAEALAAQADYFVTLDRKHFLENPRTSTLPFLLGTPGDLLVHLRKGLVEEE